MCKRRFTSLSRLFSYPDKIHGTHKLIEKIMCFQTAFLIRQLTNGAEDSVVACVAEANILNIAFDNCKQLYFFIFSLLMLRSCQ